MNFENFERMAKACAEATGKPVLFGLRPHGRGWFVHCDGIEFDGTPEEVIAPLVVELRKRIQSRLHEHQAGVATFESALNALGS